MQILLAFLSIIKVCERSGVQVGHPPEARIYGSIKRMSTLVSQKESLKN